VIEGDKILLRPVRTDDRDKTLALRMDFETNKSYMGFPYPINEFSEERWIAGLYPEGQRTRIDFAIEEKETGAFVGLISVKELDALHQRAAFGILLGREFWGKGYAKDAMVLFFRYLFEEINIHRIYLQVLMSNERAIALYERFGFKREGVLRQHHFQGGRLQDVLLMGLLREEFEALNSRE